MATLAFNPDGQSYVSDVFEGGKVIQLAFQKEGTQVLFVETRLGATLPWKTIDSRITERSLVVNIPSAGEGQEFRLNCIAEPVSAEIIVKKETGGSSITPGVPIPKDTVDSNSIVDGSIREEDLSPEIEAGDDDIHSIFHPEETQGVQPGHQETEEEAGE